MDKEIQQFYDGYHEHERLQGDSIERLRTQELISRFLSDPPRTILDVGGATGIYSFWLSELGHSVHLVDASPKHVERATGISSSSKHPLITATVGDGRSLEFEDETFDAVLMMGPLYHLTERVERIKALKEAWRVMKPGAFVFCAAISRFAAMIDGFLFDYVEDPDYVDMMLQDVIDGQHRSPPGKTYFTTSFFHLPEELESEIIDSGFALEGLYSVEGISEMIPNVSERFKDDISQYVIRITPGN